MERAEILIVGAGLAGASAAWWLAGDARVLVIEQGAAAGAEASAQNAGMQRRLVADPAERALACRSAEILGELIRGRWAENPCFRRTGAVVANVGETDRLTEAAADLVARGLRRIYNVVRPTHPQRDAVTSWLQRRGFHEDQDGTLHRRVRASSLD